MQIKADSVIRTILLFVTMLNQILTMTGKNPLPFAEADIYAALTTAAAIAATLWAWWKNNSFTKAAIMADDYLNKLKSEETADSIGEE